MDWAKNLEKVATTMKTIGDVVEVKDSRYRCRYNVSPEVYIAVGYNFDESKSKLQGYGYFCGLVNVRGLGRGIKFFGDDSKKLRLFAERAVRMPSILDDGSDQALIAK